MRLLYLSADPGVPVLGHKGASVHLRELAAALAAAGAELHIASPRVDAEGDELSGPARLHPIGGVQPKTLEPAALAGAVSGQSEEVAQLASRLEVDAIYERFSLFTAAGVRAAGRLQLRHVLEVNAPLREEAARYRTLPHPQVAAMLEAEVMAETSHVLAVSAPLAGTLGQEGVDPAKIEVLPNGVAAERFAKPTREPGRFTVGFAGSLKPWHGIETLVQALVRLPGVHLEVVGHGPLESELDRLPAHRVTRLGPRPHAEAIARMSRWDAGLAPYAALDRFWFSPLKILEYMAAATCPVTSDLGDAGETLGFGDRGVLVAPDDPAALASAIGELVSEPERARELGLRARAWVREHRSWSVNAQRVLAALGEPVSVGAP
jgi:glycosyltransferase involved in cell wall biosynthesis